MRLRGLKIVGLVFGIAMLAMLWFFFAPTKLGGSITYTITDGISMQPLLHENTLALIRAQSSYHVGDVVLYQSQAIHRPVLHRIIRTQAGKYFFKGDNNNFVDPGYATRGEITGKLWVHIPEAGAALGWFGKPLHAAIIAALSVMAFVLTSLGSTNPKARRQKEEPPGDALS